VRVLQTLLSEYHEFAMKIDKLNEVGASYDASLKGVDITTPVTRSKYSRRHTSQKLVTETVTRNIHEKFENLTQVHHSFLHQKNGG